MIDLVLFALKWLPPYIAIGTVIAYLTLKTERGRFEIDRNAAAAVWLWPLFLVVVGIPVFWGGCAKRWLYRVTCEPFNRLLLPEEKADDGEGA